MRDEVSFDRDILLSDIEPDDASLSLAASWVLSPW